MALLPLSIQIACLLAVVSTEPTPGRIPKVYNALITSNQNLEPSKAFPVYQPVIQESAFGFPFQPIFYGSDFQGVYPVPPGLARGPLDPKAPEHTKENPSVPEEPDSSTPKVSPDSPDGNAQPTDDNKGTPQGGPPLPPSTQSPIPLNQFGLPPAVLPLGRFDPTYNGFTQISPFYSYPGFRFYDPYDPYNLNVYSNLPPYFRGLPSAPGFPVVPQEGSASSPPTASTGPTSEPAPPSEPSDLNVLNYSSKDPAIPNVPPPPLPQGGLKSDDKSE